MTETRCEAVRASSVIQPFGSQTPPREGSTLSWWRPRPAAGWSSIWLSDTSTLSYTPPKMFHSEHQSVTFWELDPWHVAPSSLIHDGTVLRRWTGFLKWTVFDSPLSLQILCNHPQCSHSCFHVWCKRCVLYKLTECTYSHSRTCSRIYSLIFRKCWLDWAKTDFEITAGPYRAGRAVSQLWGYHYSVAGCQGKVSVLRSLSNDASHMYYDCEAQQ